MNRPERFEEMKMLKKMSEDSATMGVPEPPKFLNVGITKWPALGVMEPMKKLNINADSVSDDLDNLMKLLRNKSYTKRDALIRIHEVLSKTSRELMVNKNADYGLQDDPMANFQLSKSLLGIKPSEGILIRMGDKLSRIGSFLQKGEFKVSDEGLDDTIKDIINYAVLLRAQLLFEEMEA